MPIVCEKEKKITSNNYMINPLIKLNHLIDE